MSDRLILDRDIGGGKAPAWKHGFRHRPAVVTGMPISDAECEERIGAARAERGKVFNTEKGTMAKLLSIHERAAAIEARLHEFLHNHLLPELRERASLDNLVAHVKKRHLSVFDVHLSHGKRRLGKQPIIAELRIDVLNQPAKVHVFMHHYPAEHALHQLLEEQKEKFAHAIGKTSVLYDFSHSKKFKQFVHTASTLKSASANMAHHLGKVMKTAYKLKDPLYQYAPLPKALRNFGMHAPQHVEIHIEKTNNIKQPKACIITISNLLHEKEQPTIKIQLSPELHDRLEHTLKPIMSAFYDEFSKALGEDISVEYHKL